MGFEVVGSVLMLKSLLRTLLTIELLLYVWAGGHLLQVGVDGLTTVAVMVLMAMLWRLSHALGSYLVAAAMRWRDGRVLPLGNSLAALASELKARVISYNWSQAFDGLALGGDPAGPATGMPVLLVHGYFSNRGMWWRFRQQLVAADVGPVYTITLEPLMGSIDTMAERLATRITDICRETGRDQLVLVAHSMGGLVTRAYMAREGDLRIARFITLGSPHHGTQIASLGLGECARQMRYESEWLSMLEDMEAASPPQMPALSIYTLSDDLVYPPESSVLAWAESVPVSAIGHVALLYSPSVAARVINAIRQPVFSRGS
jgi:triacylglycerol esterase/lipase EstA (alpha/beta hydrolase family)